MATDKIQTSLRLEEEMLLKITYISKVNHRSLNAQLEYITQKCIEEYEAEKGEIPLSDANRYRK